MAGSVSLLSQPLWQMSRNSAYSREGIYKLLCFDISWSKNLRHVRQRSCTWSREISFWTFWMRRTCTVREWRCWWCRWEGWSWSWWGVEDWEQRETRCWTGHFCCSFVPLWEQTATGSPGVSELRLPKHNTWRRLLSFTKQQTEFEFHGSVSYLFPEALSEFVSRGRVALGFLGQLSSGYVGAGV